MADVGALAAFTAAGISLATLVVTTVVSGSRERVRWARDSLTEAFVAFVDASWRVSDAVKRRVAAEAAGAAAAAIQHERDLAAAAHSEMRSQLTRVRLLASTAVKDAGVDLIRRHVELRDAAAPEVPGLLRAVSGARQHMITVAKQEMRLRR